MKKLFLTAFAASLMFSGWQAAAVTTTAQAGAGAGILCDADDATDAAKPKKKDKKAKKEKKDKKEKADKKGKKDKKAKNGKKGKKGAIGAVGKYLEKVKFFNGEPDLEAEYFIYLQSASWCGPCNMEMPHVVEQYKAMKEDGRVEIILVSHDRTKEKGEGFLKQYKAEFAGILVSEQDALALPGFVKAAGIPNAIIVDAEGKVLYTGHPGPLFGRGEWKKHTIDREGDK